MSGARGGAVVGAVGAVAPERNNLTKKSRSQYSSTSRSNAPIYSTQRYMMYVKMPLRGTGPQL